MPGRLRSSLYPEIDNIVLSDAVFDAMYVSVGRWLLNTHPSPSFISQATSVARGFSTQPIQDR